VIKVSSIDYSRLVISPLSFVLFSYANISMFVDGATAMYDTGDGSHGINGRMRSLRSQDG
jgi:hypothetical protein